MCVCVWLFFGFSSCQDAILAQIYNKRLSVGNEYVYSITTRTGGRNGMYYVTECAQDSIDSGLAMPDSIYIISLLSSFIYFSLVSIMNLL